ncbi:MAG TPA: hypothetical protein VD966_00365 [Pyrinomonadaceae bacterium]|nr:hypothetical protein [Pyrinomonadaceae bacterium]
MKALLLDRNSILARRQLDLKFAFVARSQLAIKTGTLDFDRGAGYTCVILIKYDADDFARLCIQGVSRRAGMFSEYRHSENKKSKESDLQHFNLPILSSISDIFRRPMPELTGLNLNTIKPAGINNMILNFPHHATTATEEFHLWMAQRVPFCFDNA